MTLYVERQGLPVFILCLINDMQSILTCIIFSFPMCYAAMSHNTAVSTKWLGVVMVLLFNDDGGALVRGDDSVSTWAMI